MNASSFLDHISKVAPPPTTTSPILEPADSEQQIGLCMAGAHLLHQPLAFPCGHHICAQCLRREAKSAHTLHCTPCDTTHELVPESATSPSFLFLRKEIHCDKHPPSQGLNPLHNTLVQHTSLSPIQEAAPPLRPHKGPAPCFTILKQRRVTSEKVTTRRKLPGCVSH